MRTVAALLAIAIVAITPEVSLSQPGGLQKIRHVVVIMQENRSFDSYFGTYPGAGGIPQNVCIPDPGASSCQQPYHDSSQVNGGSDHDRDAALADIDGGKMDGFVASAEGRP